MQLQGAAIAYEKTRLVGESPLTAAFGDMALYEAMKDQQQQFLANRASPSAVLSTDLVLGVPILTSGLKVVPWTTPGPPKDMQLGELLKLTSEHSALAFRIPLQILWSWQRTIRLDFDAHAILASERTRLRP